MVAHAGRRSACHLVCAQLGALGVTQLTTPPAALGRYDTGYTERYMGTPSSNPAGYEQSSLFRYAADMQASAPTPLPTRSTAAKLKWHCEGADCCGVGFVIFP